MARLRNAVVALEKAQLPIYKETILKTIALAERGGVAPADMVKRAEGVTREAREAVELEISMQRPKENMLSLGSASMDFV